MNTISLENIKSLNSKQFTELLLKLLHLEYIKHSFTDCQIYVPQNITTADGGEDGRLITSDYKNSKWIIDNFCLFQSKATSMSRGDCKNEILNTKNDALKKKVKEVFENTGTYILFTIDDYVQQNLEDRIEGFREAIRLVESDEYASNAKIKIYDANLIKDWTNEYISAVTFVQFCCGIDRPKGLQIWPELKSYRNNSADFKTNTHITSLINKIRTDIFNKKNIRIEGASGIGKTRLACEIFSPGESVEGKFDLKRKSISESFIYFDIGKGNIQEIFDFIQSTVTKYPAVLVLDNCDPKNHDKFLEEVCRTGSLQTVITIDYEKCNSLNYDLYNLIELKGEMFTSVVEEILKDQYSNSSLSDNDINYLINFSEGNPKMAINFVKAAIEKRDLNQGFDRDLLEKLIFGRENIKEIDFKVLKLCSVFKYFEYPTEEFYRIDKNAYTLLLEHVHFFSNYLKVESNNVEIILKKYLDKGVLERRGNKIIIRPNPLSLKLSILFWEELNIIDYESFINSVPKNLSAPLADQLSQLGNVGKAKELVETIWGIDGNFSTAEILNSNMGSRLFRSIVTVNPTAMAKVLTTQYLDKPKEYLSSIVEARQNLVWALEKLCFREDTFVESAKVLMCFAVSEIETYYSNNSTEYFKQLFRIFLAGTEIDYSPRIDVLNWGLKKQDSDFDSLIIKACATALIPSHNLHKMLGAERQGGLLPLEDYRPKSQDDINEYRTQIIEILSKFAFSENQYQLFSQRIIYSNIIDLFEFNFDTDKLRIVLDRVKDNPIDRKDFIKSLYSQASAIRISEKQRDFIINYIEAIKDNSIEERILYNVSEPKAIIKTIGEEVGYIDKGKLLAEKFAEDVVNEKIDIQPYFKNLLLGNQSNSFDFGKKLAELSDDNQAFIDNLISSLLSVEKEQFNISFFFGYISPLSEIKKLEIFDKLILNKSSFAFNVFRLLDLNYYNLLKLLKMISNRELPSRNLEIIKYDVIKLETSNLLNYFKIIKSFENGNIIIIETFNILLWDFNNNAIEIDKDILIFIKTIIEEENLLLIINQNNIIDFYSWSKVIKILIREFKEDICEILANQIVEFYKTISLLSGSNQEIAEIANLTLDLDFKNCWEIYVKIVSDNGIFLFWQIFDMSFISGVGPNHPFFKNENRNINLLNWLTKNKDFSAWIIRVAPLFDENGNHWFYFTESLINIFGSDEHFISELSSNLHSMTTWGSRVPYLTARLKLVEQLKDHKIDRVQKWAAEEIEEYNRAIKIEKIKDDEGFLGL